ncbi:PEP-CTERM protein-sorting domain-containing protein [Duganella sacchari]|uniref:PEP-CTERM protein-sorting domain-containing protein n=1 Tax=Duganella sacchari TaxID=551987 RepID=A0A1M7QWZ1_9BURK|nr:FxDxF family PEP-CTERM protein [Duganella sacchari]SHN36579.1 PEP-CTERM protein-sorting domain-containing protein [Duganella sacchari]
MKKLVLTTLFALASVAAKADTFVVDLVHSQSNPAKWTAKFGNSFAIADREPFFEDYYTFAPALGGQLRVNGGLLNIFSDNAENITFKEVTLNGYKFDLSKGTTFNLATLPTTVLTGPLKLHVFGKYGEASSYSGTINITTAVPEPETYAMLLGGLALVGAVVRRRKAAKPSA